MDTRRSLGNQGEELAAEFLKRKGMQIVARQWRATFGEIDLVAKDRNELVFVEVKTRRGSMFGYPEEAVTRKKFATLTKLAEWYCRSKSWHGKYRIDVVAITLEPREIRHIVGVGLL